MGLFDTRPADDFAFENILYDKRDWVARITLNRPHNYNAYSTPTLEELATAFRDAAFDDEVGVIVYTGAGDRAFCTGGDVKEYEALYTTKPRDYWKYMGLFQAYIESIVNSGKPVIARLNGMAVGGGNESQMACDLAVMAEHAWIGQVGTRVGSVAAGGATQWLPIMIGDRRAREMLFFNGQIPARQCLEWGLVNRVVPSVTKDGDFVEGATEAGKGQDGYAINLDVQAAAPVRPIGPKRSDDDVAALRDRPVERVPIQNAIRRINEEMENRAIVPEIPGTRWLVIEDVSLHPLHPPCGVPKTILRYPQRGRRHIKDAETLKPRMNEAVDQD